MKPGEVVALRCTYDPAIARWQCAGRPQGAGDPALGCRRRRRAGRNPPVFPPVQPPRSRRRWRRPGRPQPGLAGGADRLPWWSRRCWTAPIGEAVQFERTGYFAADPNSRPDRLVFNRTVGLRDTWAKVQAGQRRNAPGSSFSEQHDLSWSRRGAAGTATVPSPRPPRLAAGYARRSIRDALNGAPQ